MRRCPITITLLLLATCICAQGAAEPAVKKSESGICHARGAGNYAQTKKFESFDSMESCLASGGRRAIAAPPVKKSRQGVCHERGMGSYEQTRDFEPYESMEACVAAGGRRAANAPAADSPLRKTSSDAATGGSNEWLKKGGLIAGMLALVGFMLRGPLKQWLKRRAQS